MSRLELLLYIVAGAVVLSVAYYDPFHLFYTPTFYRY